MNKKVFCIGLSRTGTTSLAHALNNIGISTIHYSLEAFVQIDKIDETQFLDIKLELSMLQKWSLKKEIKAKNVRRIEGILNSYEGFADLPFPMLYKILSDKYPDAYFIYTYRDKSSWLKSMEWLYDDAAVIWQHGHLDNAIMQWAYGTSVYKELILSEAYENHHINVNKFFEGADNFLSVKIDDGELTYDRLTRFLGLPTKIGHIERLNQPAEPTFEERKRYWRKKNNGLFMVTSKILDYVLVSNR
jgi:hypothetical protein